MVTNEHLSLAILTIDLREAFLEMLTAYAAAGERRYQNLLPLARDNFPACIARLERMARGEDLPPGHVPSTSFWLLRGDGRLLGGSRLRHYLNPLLENEGGHIGYDIRPDERGKGYGTRQLALILEEARKINIRRALVTCDADNIASARVIERNGGRYVDEVISHDSGKPISRYWIDL